MEGESKAKDMREVFKPEPEEAKRNLLETARSIDWLAPMREHPFATVGISAALGAVAAVNPKTVTVASRFVRSLIPIVEKSASIFLQAKAAKAAVESVAPKSDEECVNEKAADPVGVH